MPDKERSVLPGVDLDVQDFWTFDSEGNLIPLAEAPNEDPPDDSNNDADWLVDEDGE